MEGYSERVVDWPWCWSTTNGGLAMPGQVPLLGLSVDSTDVGATPNARLGQIIQWTVT